MSIIRDFTLYLHAGISVPPVVHVNQYDQGEVWRFTLLEEDGSQYTPSSGALIGVKADGHAIAGVTGTVMGDGRVSITETQQMTAAAGKAVFELTIDGGAHGTANFIVQVEPKPTDSAILSDSDLSIIQEGLNSVTPAAIEEKVSDWLEENFTEPPVDPSLTIANAAADAKVTGEKITELKTDLQTFGNVVGTDFLEYEKTGIGYIRDDGVVIYSTTTTGNNYMMLIDDADLISNITHIHAVLGNNTFKYGIAFDSANDQHLGYGEFSEKIAGVATIDADVPANTAKIYIYNRNGVTTPIVILTLADGSLAKIGEINGVKSDIEKLRVGINTKIPPCNIQYGETITYDYADIFTESGYYNNVGNVTPSASHKHFSIRAKGVKSVTITPTENVLGTGYNYLYFKPDNGAVTTAIPGSITQTTTYEVPSDDGELLFNVWTGDFADACTIEFSKNNSGESEIKYHSCVKKPFDFTGKKLDFFGDSITYGYIAASGDIPSHQATNQYPKTFWQDVGANGYHNYGVSGSTLSVVSGYDSIYTKIQQTTLSGDFVFVAGGVNDWQVGVNETTLKTAMVNICEYLKENFSGEVIFITPIYEAGRTPIVTPTQTLQNVRNVITRIALQYGYSVVQGWEFPFPTEDDDADYISAMFQDKIHPTELGYSMYAQALRNVLC